MTLSGELFFAVWGVLMTAHLAMLIPYSKMWAVHKSETAERIRKHNARHGYGQSVSKDVLAKSYILPFKTAGLSEFAEHNGMTAADYRKELEKQIGGSRLSLGALSYQVSATLFGVSGVIYVATTGPMSRETYLVVLGLGLCVSIVVYLLV